MNWMLPLRQIFINRRSLKNILIIVVCTFAALGFLLNHTFDSSTVIIPIRIRSSRSPASCLLEDSNVTIPSQIACNQCPLSLKESDGWFCEFDQEWQRRKRLHYIQDQQNHVSDERKFFFLHNWHPTIHCEFAQRIGEGDGGKWVCDIHKFQSINSTPPLIYSFGSNGDFRFEKAVQQRLPNSEIHTFDKNEYVCPVNVCIFHQVHIGNDIADGSKSLQMIVDDLKHRDRDIDILKVDIEGSEFPIFSELFKYTNSSKKAPDSASSHLLPYIRQILMEIHLASNTDEAESRRAHALFEGFRRNNYAIFHKEVNINDCQNVFEYTFIRLNPKFFITSKASSLL